MLMQTYLQDYFGQGLFESSDATHVEGRASVSYFHTKSSFCDLQATKWISLMSFGSIVITEK